MIVAFSVYVTRENRVIGQVNADGYPSHEAYAYVKTGSLTLALPLFQIKETTIDELDQGLEVRRSFSVPLP